VAKFGVTLKCVIPRRDFGNTKSECRNSKSETGVIQIAEVSWLLIIHSAFIFKPQALASNLKPPTAAGCALGIEPSAFFSEL
jgi:hypothetical protein